MAILWRRLGLREASSGEFGCEWPSKSALPRSSSPRTCHEHAGYGPWQPTWVRLFRTQAEHPGRLSRPPECASGVPERRTSKQSAFGTGTIGWTPMTNTDTQIATILDRYGEPVTGNVWQTEGETFIHHKTLERIAGKAKITFAPPTILRTGRDEAVLLVIGRLGERMEWSIGEALVGVNYDPPGSEPAYVYAMAEKRGKDRVILKLIELSDVVSSEEPHAVERPQSSSNENTPTSQSGSESGLVGELKRNLD